MQDAENPVKHTNKRIKKIITKKFHFLPKKPKDFEQKAINIEILYPETATI
jgi:hypothetical protein